jgi:hypothetical protein
MIKTKKLVLAGLAAAFAIWAADPTGKWTADYEGPQGNKVHTSITLKAAGEDLTGSVEGMRGGETEISNGKVKGDDLSFIVVREWQGRQLKMIYHGKIEGNVIHFTVSREGGEGRSREFDARRSS